MASRWRRFLPWIGAIAFVAACVLVARRLQEFGWSEVQRSFREVTAGDLLLAGACTAASYLTLTTFDFLALRTAGAPLPWRRAALGSFLALSIGHSVGLAALSSGTIRYRVYAGFGVSGARVAAVIVHCGVTVALGLCTLGGAACLLGPRLGEEVLGVSRPAVVGLGLLCLAAPVAWLVLAWRRDRPLRVRRFEVPVPSVGVAALQVLVGTVNFWLVATAFHMVLPEGAGVSYADVVGAYAVGNALGIVSHVPGGLGVIEMVLLKAVGEADVVAALVAFRLVYYVAPLLLGGIALAVYETRSRAAGAAERAGGGR